MFRAHGGAAIAGKAGYLLSCAMAAVVLVASGFAYYVKAQVTSIGGSNAISGAPSPSVGAMNILLMGLESRTDWNGNILPDDVLAALHAGSRQQIENGLGGNATNTLILIHIFPGGKKAVGFSIPRDDFVNLSGTMGVQNEGKIDQAYGIAMSAEMNKVKAQNSKISQDQLSFQGNEAGRKATIQTVQALTGVHIDHFAELNLDGFYELAKVFGGIEVCVNHYTADPTFSGGVFLKGYHHLNAKQSLAFVRQRHGLTNGDLDRTHRQQAVLDYVIWKLKHQGVLSDLGQLTSLLNVAKQYLITDSSWNLLDFIKDMQSLTGKNLTFKTLPVKTTDGQITLGGQTEDVNLIDPAFIKQTIQQAFAAPPGTTSHAKKPKKTTAPAPPPSTVTVDVYNGGHTFGLGRQVSQALVKVGYKGGQVGNPPAPRTTTQVTYGAGASANGAKIAGYFGVSASASTSVSAGHVKVVLGADTTSVPAAVTSAGNSSGGGATPGPTTSPTSSADDGQAGSAVMVKANAAFGIPCVD
jgi:LCP family protein required for cell wall assembly